LNQYIFRSKGLLFKAQPKAAIRSVGPGVIIFSDVIPHWRETLIVQHDDHYYTVYAGLKEGSKKLKDTVEKNEIIGEALSDEFYFELRHFDNPINPTNWFKESL
jgi:murein hydrolase activator